MPSRRAEAENFESISESELPTIGDTSTVSTPSTISQEEVNTVEGANNTSINETSVVEASTRDESQDSLLGEKPASHVEMETETKELNTATIREESQDSMAEIKKIISTPIDVNDANSDVDMSQQEQETNEHEVTITAILEEINKSSSSKSKNSVREEQSNESGLNNMQSSEVEFEGNLVNNEQSIRDESFPSMLGEMSPEPPSNTPTNQQVEVTTMGAALQNINSSELLIPREEFTLIDDHDSLGKIVIYDIVVKYQAIIQYDADIIEVKAEPNERNPSENILGNTSQNLIFESNNDVLEPTTMSQVVISHVEEVLAKSFGEPSDE